MLVADSLPLVMRVRSLAGLALEILTALPHLLASLCNSAQTVGGLVVLGSTKHVDYGRLAEGGLRLQL